MEYLLIRLGIVGAGHIAPHHIQAAKLTGFQPVAICGKRDSEKARSIAHANPGLNAAVDLDALLEEDLDALLVAVSTESAVDVLERCCIRGLPTLIEKPVTIHLNDLYNLENRYSHLVRVGYNRRFYSSVDSLKMEINEKPGFVQVVIPELSPSSISNTKEKSYAIMENSVHILDLLFYLFGEIRIFNKGKQSNDHGEIAIYTQFTSNSGIQGNITFLFNAPENTSIKYWKDGLNLELSPIEIFRKSEGMEVSPPTRENPIKTYKKSFNKWQISNVDQEAKPGFIRQYQAFKSFVDANDNSVRLATLGDARRVMELAHEIVEIFD